MLRCFKNVVIALLFTIFAGCAGGGCSSGCSCGGIEPLANGFNPNQRIENAASVRLTDSGLTFFEDNLGTLAGVLQTQQGEEATGVIKLPLSESSGSFSISALQVVSYTICPGGADFDTNTCVIELDLENAPLTITSEDPHNIRVEGPLPARAQNIAIDYTLLVLPESTQVVVNGNGACDSGQTFANIDMSAVISIEIDNDEFHARSGYSRLRIDELTIDEQQVTDAVNFCGGGLDELVVNGLKDELLPLLTDGLVSTAKDQMEEALCQQANAMLDPTCPAGTIDVDDICRYGPSADDECVPILLGMDARLDAGQLLASISPGTSGVLEFLLAAGGHSPRPDSSGFAWGDLNPIDGGATLGFYGGAEPAPLSGCVPTAPVTLPTDIPIPDELHTNTLSDWPSGTAGPHVGFALSERYLNYTLAQAYNAGALCLGITGESIPELSTALISVGLGTPSMKELARLQQPAPMAITVRPQAPPVVTIGDGTNLDTDPLLKLQIEQLAFDFYVWSTDRFVRVMTATFDVEVPLNLEVTEEGLLPVLDKLLISNGVVTNTELLREDPEQIAAALEGLLGSFVGSALGGALSPIDFNSQLGDLGVELIIPPTVEGEGSAGLGKLTKDTDNFLGLFAALGIADPPSMMRVDTSAALDGFSVDPEGLHVSTYTAHNGPRARLRFDANSSQNIEWQYKLDQLPWHPYSRERIVDIDDAWLRVQSKHVVQVRARVQGQPHTVDLTPAVIELPVDITPPAIDVHESAAGAIDVAVSDNVSAREQTQVRVRLGIETATGLVWHPWSEWVSASELATFVPEQATIVEVQALDEEGNVGTVQQPLIRGKGSADAGCSCNTPGAATPQPYRWWLLALGLCSPLWRRRFRRRAYR